MEGSPVQVRPKSEGRPWKKTNDEEVEHQEITLRDGTLEFGAVFPSLEALHLLPGGAEFPASPRGPGEPGRMQHLSPWQLSSADELDSS